MGVGRIYHAASFYTVSTTPSGMQSDRVALPLEALQKA